MLKQKNNIAAFFDIDLTIIKIDAFCTFLRYLYIKNIKNWKYLPIIFLFGLLRKLKLVSLKKFKEIALFSLKGMSKRDIEHLGEIFFNQEMKSNILQNAIAEIESHRKRGHYVFLISSSPDIYNKALTEYIKADSYFCSELEYNGGFTGHIKGKDCLGIEKVKRIKNLNQTLNLEIDLSMSFAYSDSFSDLPLLKLVGYPVAVNPDNKLLKCCLEENWRVENWR